MKEEEEKAGGRPGMLRNREAALYIHRGNRWTSQSPRVVAGRMREKGGLIRQSREDRHRVTLLADMIA